MPELPAQLCIVVPTFNERDNVAELVRRLERCLQGCRWEVMFVDDDSPDGTATAVRELAERVFAKDFEHAVELKKPLPAGWLDYLKEQIADHL